MITPGVITVVGLSSYTCEDASSLIMTKATVRIATETSRRRFSGSRRKISEMGDKMLVAFRRREMVCKPMTSVWKRRIYMYQLFTKLKLVFTV